MESRSFKPASAWDAAPNWSPRQRSAFTGLVVGEDSVLGMLRGLLWRDLENNREGRESKEYDWEVW